MIINIHLSIAEIYGELCIRFREIHKLEQDEQTTCAICTGRKSAHIHDGTMRCSSWVCSGVFKAKEAEELTKIQRALELLEELQKINV